MTDKRDAVAETAVEHEIYATLSIGGPGGLTYSPMLGCSCGFTAHERTWEEAGAVFDEHVATLAGGEKP